MANNVSFDTHRAFRYAIKNSPGSDDMMRLHEQYALWREGEPGRYLKPMDESKVQRYFSPGTENAALPVLLKDHEGVHLGQLNFGFIPNWRSDRPKDSPMKAVDRAKKALDIGRKTWNAASETMFDEEKHTWKDSAHDRRCIILLDGFFKYHEHGEDRIPFYISPADRDVMPVAGLWDIATIDDKEYLTCAILMQPANEAMHEINNWGEHPHGPHRMPIALKPEEFAQWLDPIQQADFDKIDELYKIIKHPEAGEWEYITVAKNENGQIENNQQALEPFTYDELRLDLKAFNG